MENMVRKTHWPTILSKCFFSTKFFTSHYKFHFSGKKLKDTQMINLLLMKFWKDRWKKSGFFQARSYCRCKQCKKVPEENRIRNMLLYFLKQWKLYILISHRYTTAKLTRSVEKSPSEIKFILPYSPNKIVNYLNLCLTITVQSLPQFPWPKSNYFSQCLFPPNSLSQSNKQNIKT